MATKTRRSSSISQTKQFDAEASLKRMIHVVNHLQKRVDQYKNVVTNTLKQKAKEFSKHSGYSYLLGYIFYLYFLLVYKTSEVIIMEEKDVSEEKKAELPKFLKERENYIFCSWHEFSFVMFVVAQYLQDHPEVFKFKQCFLTHPRWSLGPLYLLCEKTGCKIVMGSSLHEGKKGADNIVEALNNGYSTVVFPDGPYGPLHDIRKGFLHMAMQSKVPVVPTKIQFKDRTGYFSLFWHWDKKKIPLPFSRIKFNFGQPVTVDSKDDFQNVTNYMKAKL